MKLSECEKGSASMQLQTIQQVDCIEEIFI
jgi:hypothetical protein